MNKSIEMAKIAEQCERFEDMAKVTIKKIAVACAQLALCEVFV